MHVLSWTEVGQADSGKVGFTPVCSRVKGGFMGSLKRVLRVRGAGRGVARGSEMYAKSSATQSVPLLISSTSSKIDLYNILFRIFHNSNISNLAHCNKVQYIETTSILFYELFSSKYMIIFIFIVQVFCKGL